MIAPNSDESMTPLGPWLADIAQRITEAGEVAIAQKSAVIDLKQFEDEILDQDVRDFTDENDIAFALRIMGHIISSTTSSQQVWSWGKKISSQFLECATICSHLCRLGIALRMSANQGVVAWEHDSPLSHHENMNDDNANSKNETDHVHEVDDASANKNPRVLVSGEELERLVQKAMDKEPKNADHFECAGELYDFLGQLGLAQKNFELALMRQPSHTEAALHLSNILSEYDRNGEALQVLEACIKAGGTTQELLFEAAQFSFIEIQFPKQVHLLQRMHREFGDFPSSHFLMAIGLLFQNLPNQAIEEIEMERSKYATEGLHIDALLAEAHSQLGNQKIASDFFDSALAHPICEIGYLDEFGIETAYLQLRRAALGTLSPETNRNLVDQRMLRLGIASDEYFEELRSKAESCEVSRYLCYLTQPLNETWKKDSACFREQMDWDYYIAVWGVWAKDSDAAADIALTWQSKCDEEEPFVIAVEPNTEPRTGPPGVEFQGARYQEDDSEDFE